MSHKAPGRSEVIKIQTRRKRVQNIFPDRIARAPMHKAYIFTNFQVGWERAQEVHIGCAQDAFMVFQRAAGVAVECIKRDSADDGYIMIAKQTGEVRDVANLLYDRVRVRAVPHKVAQTPG